MDYKESQQPLKLLKNRSYPTYQLYVTVSNKTDLERSLIIVILETMSWLRKRFRDMEIPNEIIFPEPEDYEKVTLDDFKSFRINEGYIVEVVFIREKGIWAFHLIEPDLGPDPGEANQSRKPVPGRVFETNIAYRIYNNKLECGFKTVCSEPVETKVKCEVYRLAFIKSMVQNKNLGLEQILPIAREAFEISNIDRVENSINYIRNKDRQLPFVLIVEYKKKLDINKLEIKNPIFNVHNIINRTIEDIMAITTTDEKVMKDDLESELENQIKHKMGYAQFGYLPYKYIESFNEMMDNCNISSGDICIFYPERFRNIKKCYKQDYIKNNKEKFLNDLDEELQEYPKYKNIDYGNVIFINGARAVELQKIIEISNSKEEVVKAYEDKIAIIKSEYEKTLNMRDVVIEQKEKKIENLNAEIKIYKNKEDEWRLRADETRESFELRISKLENELDRKDKLLARPVKASEIPDWVDEYFIDRLIFHSRAVNEITSVPNNEVKMDLLCDAIDYLAYEYRDELIGKISECERDKICSERYNRSFIVEPSGNTSIQSCGKEYKVKYGTGHTGKLKEVALNLHLKVGNDNKNLLRIYLFYDNEKKLIVVGSLPKHLKTSKEK